jgi:hypothetical protein
MLGFLDGKASHRKYRLFACACWRRLLGRFPNVIMKQVIDFSEQYADRLARAGERLRLEIAVDDWLEVRSPWNTIYDTEHQNDCVEAEAVNRVYSLLEHRRFWRSTFAKHVARDAAVTIREMSNDWQAVRLASASEQIRVARATWQAAQAAYVKELQAQAAMLRDIIGNPFRPVPLPPGSRTPEVVSLARESYEQRAFELLPDLAKLFEEAGGTDGAILAHCRQQEGHVLGCWVLDLLLSYE